MTVKLIKTQLNYFDQKINALAFLPDPSVEIKKGMAVFTHGYTSHKASILNWPTRLVEEGMPALIFDLPGHYLGGFSEVESFESFKTETPRLFIQGLEVLKKLFVENFPLNEHFLDDPEMNYIFGGHSLGAMMSLYAIDLEEAKAINARSICVGLGLPPEGVTHIFDTPFYKSTLVIRGQLVSPNLDPKEVFPWIKEAKEKMTISGHKVHFITGKDDLVVGDDGTERMAKILSDHGNEVSVEKPTKLPHHQPEMAAGHVKKYLKKQGIL